MTQAAEDARSTGKRRKRRTFNWVAVSSIATLLSAITGMVTAGAGIWRPPVPIPAIKVVIVGPTAAPTDGPTRVSASPVSTAAVTPAASVLPYQADWSNGMGGWTGSNDWAVVNGMLVNDGTHDGTSMTITAPDLFAGITDYTVEADIQVVKAAIYMPSFGFVTRATTDNTGYGVGFHYENGPGYNFDSAVIWQAQSGAAGTIRKQLFSPSTVWHHYLARLKGNTISEEIDGSVVLNATDNTYLRGGRIGLWSDRAQVNVKNFKVTAA